MGEFYPQLDEKQIDFIERQHLYFTATAPAEGRINLSPKGMDTFRVLNPKQVAYLDLTGSGNETAAHVIENGRITILFCSFEKQPLILRLYGTATVIRPGHAQWDNLITLYPPLPGIRQILLIHVDTVHTSCGYGVPLYEFVEERQTLRKWAEKKGEQGIAEYWREKNTRSIDGLPTSISESEAPQL